MTRRQRMRRPPTWRRFVTPRRREQRQMLWIFAYVFAQALLVQTLEHTEQVEGLSYLAPPATALLMSSFSPRRGDRGSTIVLNSAQRSNRDTLQRALQTTFDESDIDALRQIRHDIDEKICALEARATGLRGATKWRELTLNHHAHFGPAFSCFAQRTLARARGAELAERVTDSSSARRMRLILGTINFLGDDANRGGSAPDRGARIGRTAAWSMSLQRAAAVFRRHRRRCARRARRAAKACAGDGACRARRRARGRPGSARARRKRRRGDLSRS